MNESIFEIHNRAMALADEADAQNRIGKEEEARELLRQALALEQNAAESIADDQVNAEPSRSVLFRSAASLALECQEIRLAERLIATALAGNPPDQIAEELRDLWAEVFRRMRPQDKIAA